MVQKTIQNYFVSSDSRYPTLLMTNSDMCEWHFKTSSQLELYFATMVELSETSGEPETYTFHLHMSRAIQWFHPTWSVYITLLRKVEGSRNKKSCVNKSWFVAILSMNIFLPLMSLELLLMDFICEISHPQQISRPNITLGSTHWFMISLFPRHGIELPLINEPIDRLSSAMSST